MDVNRHVNECFVKTTVVTLKILIAERIIALQYQYFPYHVDQNKNILKQRFNSFTLLAY